MLASVCQKYFFLLKRVQAGISVFEKRSTPSTHPHNSTPVF
jgi:hypothetical protein